MSLAASRWLRCESGDPCEQAQYRFLVENLEEQLRQFTERKKRVNAFELRYASSVQPEGPGWEQCERVLARRDIVGRLSEGW
jgi:hypothetical protein